MEAVPLLVAVIALVPGIALVISHRTIIPLPVMLLLVGLAFGDHGIGIVPASAVKEISGLIVPFAVAVIVFEGSLFLRLSKLRVVGTTVRRLVLINLIGSTILMGIAAHLLLGFRWPVAFVFGSLTAVTGPSVITPLLARLPVTDRIRTLLASEGVIIDPLGALLTLVLVQVAVADFFDPFGPTSWAVERLAGGLLVGIVGALTVIGIVKGVRRIKPSEVVLVTVGGAIGAFGISEYLAHESGLAAMVSMGAILANARIPHRDSVDTFYHAIIPFLLASVYVLLAASVDVTALLQILWPEGLLLMVVTMFVVRPALVLLATIKSPLTMRERLFVSSVAPRGVVAAGLAAVVGIEVSRAFGTDEKQFVAAVFLVILTTITVQMTAAPLIAKFLGVMQMRTIVAGAGSLGLAVANRLRSEGRSVGFVDLDEHRIEHVRAEGFPAVRGDLRDLSVLERAGLDNCDSVIVATGRDDQNLLLAQQVRASRPDIKVVVQVTDGANVRAFEDLGIPHVSRVDTLAAAIVGKLPQHSPEDEPKVKGLPEEYLGGNI